MRAVPDKTHLKAKKAWTTGKTASSAGTKKEAFMAFARKQNQILQAWRKAPA
jgi:hypothetical protein